MRTQELKIRHRLRAERRFRVYGHVAMGIALVVLVWLLVTLLQLGLPAFVREAATIDQAASSRTTAEAGRRLDVGWLSRPDSPVVERAGLGTAIFGSAMMLLLTALLALPLGMVSALYLQEFAPRTGWGGRMVRGLQVVINNLAAVPAIVYGLLGLAILINVFGLSRSAVITGGIVLALRIFPTVIIASRGALASVPDSMVDGALSLGASRMQAVFGHKLPIAAPGMVTGAILALAQALGEAAPLLLIGMVAYISQTPVGPGDPATALPVQIFMWAESGEPAWLERASGAIIILLLGLLCVNGLAVGLRERLTKRRHL